MSLSLNLLGGFQVSCNGTAITRFRGNKVRALLAYLVTEADCSHSRRSLATLFWPDRSDALALRNLAQTLVRLREALGDSEGRLLKITRQHIQWRGPATVDVIEFRHFAQSDAPELLETAARQYRGEFLAGFLLEDCEAFDEWLLLTRERMLRQALYVLERLTDLYQAAGDFVAASTSARRQLELDPWRELAYRQLMQALAAGGDRAAALAAFEHCRQVLHNALGVTPDAATIALAETIRAERPQASAPIPYRTLPAPLTEMFGREEELVIATDLLRAGNRLVTLIGAGGVGKTRLAIAAANVLREDFSSRVCWVPLDEVDAEESGSQVEHIAVAILRALHGRVQSSHSMLTELHAALPQHSVLLILDNCEHLPALGALLLDLLSACPRLRVLATSQERIGINGEETFALTGLPLPPTDADSGHSAAVQLFLARARRQLRQFGHNPADHAAAVRLCRLLDGVPLGIELAAHWIQHYSCDEIARAVQEDLDFLASRDQNLPPRQRSLRAVFEYAWKLLSRDEQRILARLSVFTGSFSRDAARHIAGASVTVLATLVDKSLLRRAGPGRYAMHQLLRRFAIAHLHTNPGEHARVEYAYTAFVGTYTENTCRA